MSKRSLLFSPPPGSSPLRDDRIEARLGLGSLDPEGVGGLRQWLEVALTHRACLRQHSEYHPAVRSEVLELLGYAGRAAISLALRSRFMNAARETDIDDSEKALQELSPGIYKALVNDLGLAVYTCFSVPIGKDRSPSGKRYQARFLACQLVGALSVLGFHEILDNLLGFAIKEAAEGKGVTLPEPVSGTEGLPTSSWAMANSDELAGIFGLASGNHHFIRALTWPAPGGTGSLAPLGVAVLVDQVAQAAARVILADPAANIEQERMPQPSAFEPSELAGLADELDLEDLLLDSLARPLSSSGPLGERDRSEVFCAALAAAFQSYDGDSQALAGNLPMPVRTWIEASIRPVPAPAAGDGEPGQGKHDIQAPSRLLAPAWPARQSTARRNARAARKKPPHQEDEARPPLDGQRDNPVWSRVAGEQLMVGDDIIVEILRVTGNWVRLRIDAPESVRVGCESVRGPGEEEEPEEQEPATGEAARLPCDSAWRQGNVMLPEGKPDEPKHPAAPCDQPVQANLGAGPMTGSVLAARDMHISASASGVTAAIINGDVYHYAQTAHAEEEWRYPHIGHIPEEAQCFQARVALDELEPFSAREASAPCQVLTGLGGIGKTQLAAFYARRALKNGDVGLLVWVDAATRESIIYWLAEAAIYLRGADSANRKQAAKVFLAWLQSQRSSPGRRWLVVFDDLTDPDDLQDLLPSLDAESGGKVLITTRRQDVSIHGAEGRLIDVGLFSPDEAHDYLTRSLAACGRADDGMEIAKLADTLGHLPLALSQAVAYMVKYRRTVAEYRKRLADAGHPLGDLMSRVATTWSVSVNAADQLPPRGLSRPLLALTSVLDPGGIPEALFSTQAARRFQAETRVSGDSPEVTADQASDALQCLRQLSLITIDPGTDSSSIGIHSLVQRASLEQATENDVLRAALAAADALIEIWAMGDASPGLRRMLRENALHLARAHFDLLWQPGRDHHEILTRAGHALASGGQPAEAVQFFGKLADTSDRLLAPNHLATLRARAARASYQGRVGNPRTAARELAGVLSDLAQQLGHDHPEALVVRGRLASWQGRSGDLAGAISALEELCEAQQRILPPDDPEMFSTRATLASFRGQAGDSAGAVEGFRALLADEERALGRDNPQVLITRANAAKYLHGGTPAAVMRTLQQVLADQERILSRHHPDAMATRLNLASARAQAGDPQGAAEDIAELLADRERILGPDHPLTLATRYSLHTTRHQARQREGAAQGLKELLDDQVRILGHDHPDTLLTRARILSWRKRKNARPESISQTTMSFEELVADQLRILGPQHPRTLSTRRDLASWRAATGDPAGAARDCRRLASDQEKAQGSRHPRTLAAWADLAKYSAEAGDYPAAAKAAQALWTIQVSLNGVDDPRSARTFKNLLDYQRDTGSRDGVVNALSELARHRAAERGPEDPETLVARSWMAWELLRADHKKRAMQELTDLIPVMERVLGPQSEQILKARFYLACSYNFGLYNTRARDALKSVLRNQRSHLGKDHPDAKRTEFALKSWRAGQAVVWRTPITQAHQASEPPVPPPAARGPAGSAAAHAGSTRTAISPEEPASTAEVLAAIREAAPLRDARLETRLGLSELDAESALEARCWLGIVLTHAACLPGRTGIRDQYANTIADVLAALRRAGIAAIQAGICVWLLKNQPDLATYELESKARQLADIVHAAITDDLGIASKAVLPPTDLAEEQEEQGERAVRGVMLQVIGLIVGLGLHAPMEDILTSAIDGAAKAAGSGDTLEEAALEVYEEAGRPRFPREAIGAVDDLARMFGLPYGNSMLRRALVHRSWHPTPGMPVPSRFTNTTLAMVGVSVTDSVVTREIAQGILSRPPRLDLRPLLWNGDKASSLSTVFDGLQLGQILVTGEGGKSISLDNEGKASTARAVLAAACVSGESGLFLRAESFPACVRDWLTGVVENHVCGRQRNSSESGRIVSREIDALPGQRITLGDSITIEVSRVAGDSAWLQFTAPNDILIRPREDWEDPRKGK